MINLKNKQANYINVSLIFFVIFTIASCTPKPTSINQTAPTVLNTNTTASGQQLKINFTQGIAHNHPTFAVFITDIDSNYIETLYVTNYLAKGVFAHGKAEKGKWKEAPVSRPATLPVWLHKRNITNALGQLTPDSATAIADAYTGATPNANFTLNAKLSNPNIQKFILFVEVNQTWDWNEYWTNNKYPDNENYKTSSQPALVYTALVNLSETQKQFNLQLIGHSHYSGANGLIYTSLNTITTAKNIFENITLTINN